MFLHDSNFSECYLDCMTRNILVGCGFLLQFHHTSGNKFIRHTAPVYSGSAPLKKIGGERNGSTQANGTVQR